MQKKALSLFLIIILAVSLIPSIFFGIKNEQVFADTSSAVTSNKIENGSFETPTISGTYSQLVKSAVPYWETTAYNTTGENGKIELFKENTGTYIANTKLTPSDGLQGAELNADEESSLYQVIDTTPSSVYLWGLDHRGRRGVDTMALVIGPEQEVDPSKNKGSGYDAHQNYYEDQYKYGKDQMMQMVQWLKEQGVITADDTENVEKITMYSKKFAENGSFQNNEDNMPFSMTYSDVYSEEWAIWVMASDNDQWYSYGSNDISADSLINEYGNIDSEDIDSPYFYKVPAGQPKTLFSFVSVDTAERKINGGTTIGNLLDNINFEIYNNMTGSSTDHGSASLSDSGVNVQGDDNITKNHPIDMYTSYGTSENLVARIKAEDVERVGFAGVYITRQVSDSEGNISTETEFLVRDGNEIEQTEAESLDDWQLVSTGSSISVYKSESAEWLKQVDEDGNITYIYPGKWVKKTDSEGNISYLYQLTDITYAFDAHFVFLKCPTITYDTNGGKPYQISESETGNTYDFKPVDADGKITYIEPYQSHEPEGWNDGWKFHGWLITDDEGVVKTEDDEELLLDGVHSAACNYMNAVGEDSKQAFLIINGENDFTTSGPTINDNGEYTGQQWTTTSPVVYDKSASGLTMIAQWSWKQTFVPQTKNGSDYEDTTYGGTVAITKGNDLGEGSSGSSYCYGKIDEVISAKAAPKEGYNFDGWYDEDGNLLTQNIELIFTQAKGQVRTYYAKFSSKYTQHYIRQVKQGDEWIDTYDDNIGTLTSYENNGAAGQLAVSRANEVGHYKFVGWYDSDGNKVDDSLVEGNTLNYYITGDATYYARFEAAYIIYFKAQTENSSGVYEDSTAGGVTDPVVIRYFDNDQVSSRASSKETYDFAGWYDEDGNKLTDEKVYTFNAQAAQDEKTIYARFARHEYTVKFIAYLKTPEGEYNADNSGGTVNPTEQKGFNGAAVKSTAAPATGYKFVGWYTSINNMKNNSGAVTTAEYSRTINKADATYYALFEDDRSLRITKSVTGNMGDTTKQFQFTAAIDNIGTKYECSFYNLDGEPITDRTVDIEDSGDAGKLLSFTLADGESLVISHLPGNAEYSISETDYSDVQYTTSFTEYDENGDVITDDSSSGGVMTNNRHVTVTNDRQVVLPPTGVSDDMSWLWILPMIILLVPILFNRKRAGR